MSDLAPATPGQEVEVEQLRSKIVAEAHQLRERAVAAVATVATAWWELAAALHEFHEARAWEPLGYSTLEEFLAEPELGLSRRQFFRLAQLHRELVEHRGVPMSALEGVDPSKVEPALPALKAGQATIPEVLADARALGARDMRDKYRAGRDPSAPIDPTNDPPRIQCGECGRWYTPEEPPG